jgi:hemerythrin-like domain-containing protein
MKNPPLKRHVSLQPLSRDHYNGLVQAQHLTKAADGGIDARRAALADFVRAWNEEIAEHFGDEERLLYGLIPDAGMRQRLLDEHATLRSLADQARASVPAEYPPAPAVAVTTVTDDAAARSGNDPDADLLRRLGEALHDHIRWEERELFPAIEQAADAAQLEALERETAVIEQARPRSRCPGGV